MKTFHYDASNVLSVEVNFNNGRRAFTCYLRSAGRGVGREILHHPSHLSMANKIAVHVHLGDSRGPPSPPDV